MRSWLPFRTCLSNSSDVSIFVSCAAVDHWCLLLMEPFLPFAGFHLCELLKHRFLFSERREGIAS